MSSSRKGTTIIDYPEHLNPFYEDDNHRRIRFWRIPSRHSRSNSFSFQSIKDFKNNLGRSFSIRNKNKVTSPTPSIRSDSSVNSYYSKNRYTYNEPPHQVVLFPKSRFQERLKTPDIYTEISSAASSKSSGSLTNISNPFEEESSSRKTPPKKKKRAPPPPPIRQSSLVYDSTKIQADTACDLPGDNEIECEPEQEIQTEEIHPENSEQQTNPSELTTTTSNDNDDHDDDDDVVSLNNNIPNCEISYNSELILTPKTLLKDQQPLDETTDLLEMVQKLHLEVQKLTDDTNNNNIETVNDLKTCDNTTQETNRLKKTELSIILDPVTEVPTSPRLVRLKKDNEWIRTHN